MMPSSPPSPTLSPPVVPDADDRLRDLAQVIRAYNAVTENLEQSHTALQREVARLQEQLASADAQLQRSKRLAALGEMAAGIAHEVRNPLAAIQLYAAMLIEDLTPHAALRDSAETAGKIAQAVRGLDAVVGDVLTFARELSPRHSALDVEALLQRVTESHAPAIEAGGVRVTTHVQGELVLQGDGDLLHQALLNLVRNAVDAMGGPRDATCAKLLTLKASAREGRVILSVRDTGPGIAAADIDRIFNPFFTTRNTGTGLGLAIVHRIVDAHGGTVTAFNDGGAVFELSLPAAQPEAEAPTTHNATPNATLIQDHQP